MSSNADLKAVTLSTTAPPHSPACTVPHVTLSEGSRIEAAQTAQQPPSPPPDDEEVPPPPPASPPPLPDDDPPPSMPAPVPVAAAAAAPGMQLKFGSSGSSGMQVGLCHHVPRDGRALSSQAHAVHKRLQLAVWRCGSTGICRGMHIIALHETCIPLGRSHLHLYSCNANPTACAAVRVQEPVLTMLLWQARAAPVGRKAAFGFRPTSKPQAPSATKTASAAFAADSDDD